MPEVKKNDMSRFLREVARGREAMVDDENELVFTFTHRGLIWVHNYRAEPMVCIDAFTDSRYFGPTDKEVSTLLREFMESVEGTESKEQMREQYHNIIESL